MSLELKIKKDYGSFVLDVAFSAKDYEVLALLGASGCGKSMTLRCIAGIETPDEGYIIVNGKTYFDSERRINLSPQKRNVGLLFQNYALFPNMTVKENIRTGLRREKDKKRREEKLEEALHIFQLADVKDHFPHQLSGGQQQRVALARIMAGDTDILLLDEPFSALDAYLRWQLEKELLEKLSQYEKTTVFVSHDRDEVYRIADKLAVYHQGHIDSFDDKRRVFADPKTWIAAMLTGCKNLSEVIPSENGCMHAVAWDIDIPAPEGLVYGKDYNSVGIRAHDLKIVKQEDKDSFSYDIVEEIADGFERVLLIQKRGSDPKVPIHWLISKKLLELQALTGYVSIPKEALMWLKK